MATAGSQPRGAFATCRRRARTLVRRLLRGVRDWCGDSAYERYLIAAQRHTSLAGPVLTQEQFYVEQLNRRYSRPNRCC
jgi:uncharacterized short protein YbdD (DUF466 family)